jgi:hypothetical protein
MISDIKEKGVTRGLNVVMPRVKEFTLNAQRSFTHESQSPVGGESCVMLSTRPLILAI